MRNQQNAGDWKLGNNAEQTIKYIEESFNLLPFEYVSFYVPTFTLDRKWVVQFCEQMAKKKKTYPWKCVTLLSYLDNELLSLMAKSGCIRISFGIETLNENASDELPKCKKDTKECLKQISATCKKLGIEVNCFLMFGVPGDSPPDVFETLKLCQQLETRVRPTIYTPYHLLKDNMTVEDVSNFNRQFFLPEAFTAEDAEQYYKLFYLNPLDKPTKVMEKIKNHAEAS